MWDQRYSEPGYVYGTEPNDFLKDEFKRIPEAGKVLCLAEGEGRNAVFLAAQGYRVTAVDQSEVGLHKAEKLAAEKGVSITTQVADLANYNPGENRWDGIVSIAAHIPPSARKNLHKHVVQGLKPDGVLILEAYTERQLEMDGTGGPPVTQKELFMSLSQLKEELAGLQFIIGLETEREVNEGKYHRGKSAVVQVVAVKPQAIR
jgi:2-polyprenyl-3-methyl-5-hydroxy-6-metoxy-1,4-benzoquinol methylase